MQNLTFKITSDGSKTLFNESVGEHYHSRHGALQESRHVFLNSGMIYFLDQTGSQSMSILEVGFGTGLNFLLSAEYSIRNKVHLSYTGIEAFPLNQEFITNTGYNQYISDELWNSFVKQYPVALLKQASINPHCELTIFDGKLLDFSTDAFFDVVYFDAFASIHQPEMWTSESLSHTCSFLQKGGVFVTYAITGNLKRALKDLGFQVEKAPGAPGKREMLRAVKL